MYLAALPLFGIFFLRFPRWNNQKGAENICVQLGYTGGTKYTAPGGTGPIHAGNRLCKGGEKSVWECPLQKDRKDTTRCSHKIDQGVACTGPGKIFEYV